MVARGASAARPVLLACRHWEPLGLARRLPSLGVGAWRSGQLLPWRVQCPVRVCAALAAGSGGSGRYLVMCLSRFPLPAPRVPRCVWRAVLSGCPLPSLAGTPFQAVCAFRELGPVALLVVPACPLRVFALALPRRLLPPPWVVWRAHLERSQHWALVGPFHVVRAPPRVLPRSLAPSGVLGGGRSGPGSPLPGLGLCASREAGPWRLCAGRRALGGGACAVPPVCAAGGASRAGGRSALFRPSAFPWQATKRVSLALFWSWRAWSPYHSGPSSPAFSGRDLCGVLARWRGLACSPPFLWEPAAEAGGLAVLRLLSRAGGGGTIPPASGGGGRHPRGLRAAEGAGGGGGRAAASLLPLPWPPSGAFPPGVRVRSGSWGRPGGWGDEGRPLDRSPGGPFRPEPPLCPPRVGNGHGGGHGVRRRAPPSGVVRAPLRRAGVGSPVGRDPRGSRRLEALGRAVCRSSRIPPPASRSLLGEGGRPLGSGGAEGRSCGPRARGGGRGGGGGAALPPPVPPPRRASACHPLSPACPPWVYSCRGGCRAAAGVRRSPVGRQLVSAAGGGGGGGNPPALVRAPAFPRPASEVAAPFALSWAPPVRRRSAAGRAGACGWFTGGACRSRGAPSPRVQRPLRGGWGRRLFGLPPSALGPEGEGGGGVGGALWSPGAAP